MFPLDFPEFCDGHRVSAQIMGMLRECFEQAKPIGGLIHEKMLELFCLNDKILYCPIYLAGMPEREAEWVKSIYRPDFSILQQGE